MKQTTLSDYFKGTVKSTPTPNTKLIKRKRTTFQRFNSTASSASENFMNVELSQRPAAMEKTPIKRKLRAPIMSDEEDGNENSESFPDQNITKSQGTCSPAKKPVVQVGVNKPNNTSPDKVPRLVTTPETPTLTTNRSGIIRERHLQESNALHLRRRPTGSSGYSSINVSPPPIARPRIIKILSDAEVAQKLIDKITNSDTSSDEEDLLLLKPVAASQRAKNLITESPVSPLKNTSPVKNAEAGVKKKVNYYYIEVLKKFFDNIKLTSMKQLLSKDELNLLVKFFEMSLDYQYVCMKLFMWRPIWRNIFKFVEQIGLSMNPKQEVIPMLTFLVQNGFVQHNYENDDLTVLLAQIDVKDLKDLARSFKIPIGRSTKQTVINKLIEICHKQTTLSFKSTESILKERIQLVMGYCFKISDELKDCLFKVFLLNTFTNRAITKPEDYFAEAYLRNICYPDFEVEDYLVFSNEEEFSRYAEAVKYSHELDTAIENRDNEVIYQICVEVFRKLGQLVNQGNTDSRNRPKFLEKFGAVAQFVSVIVRGSQKITSVYYAKVQAWLEYILMANVCPWKRVTIYCHLSLIHNSYHKDHAESAKTVIKAFREEELSERRRYELAHRSKVLDKKTYQLPQLYRDQLTLLEPPSCDREYPVTLLEKKSIKPDQPGMKRKYVIDDNGSKLYLNVEDLAIYHYKQNGFPNGMHCEGRLILSLFTLLFWDLIYDHYVQGAFVSKYQTVPLDMYTKFFYLNRKSAIDTRIDQIRISMKDETLKKFLVRNYNNHSHESSLINVDGFMSDVGLSEPDQLYNIILCIGRSVLARIFMRLVDHVGENQSGMPDLFIWNEDNKQCKFVEVKSENDSLSTNQKLWLNYLQDNNADVEVCHVLSSGSRKGLKVDAKTHKL